MSNSSSALNGLPIWVKAVATVGIPSVIALYLLLSVTGAIPSALSSEHSELRKDQQEQQVQRQREHNEQTKAQQEQAQLLRLICANTAQDTATKLECLRR